MISCLFSFHRILWYRSNAMLHSLAQVKSMIDHLTLVPCTQQIERDQGQRVIFSQSQQSKNAASILRLYNYNCSIKSNTNSIKILLFQGLVAFIADATYFGSLHDNKGQSNCFSNVYSFLNQSRTGHRPAHAWFLKIVSVQMSVCVSVCLFVCESVPEAINNQWRDVV